MNYCAVITAGGRVDAQFADVLGTDVKALAPFGGTTFLFKTIAALRGAGIDRIAVVGGPAVRTACRGKVERIVDESPDGAENVRRALRAWGELASLLYLTSDMPFISAQALLQFLARVPQETIALPLTEWADFARTFPGAPPFGITLAGEKVVNGGAFVIPPNAAQGIESLAARFFDARKSALRMAQLAGPGLLVRFLCKRLGVRHLEMHAGRLLGVPALALRRAPAELAYDVDILEEYTYALSRA